MCSLCSLGINGAGKTTTMQILTGDQYATAGHATVGGFDIETQLQEVRGTNRVGNYAIVQVANY